MSEALRVLIVEDHEPSAEALAKILEKRLLCPVECTFARTLDSALHIAADLNADITILDPGLPDCTREQAAAAIPLFPPPVIVITDFEDDENGTFERFCYANFAHNYLRKEQLRETILEKQGAKLVTAIIRAHWRSSLPPEEVRKKHREALDRRRHQHAPI